MSDPPRRTHVMTIALLTTTVVALLVAGGIASTGTEVQPNPQNLKRLSIEELMQIDVTLATRQPEPIGTIAAAIDIITADDIRRSGVTTIADAIGLATGVHVARFNNGSWAISSRGFNATSANKLLVMVDGRTEFSPLFSGVFWNMLDYVLEDIDRIEVIRGPGATLWGANAVNGVINIVTRAARDTQGTYLGVGSGNEDPALADVRYGGTAGKTAYRVYAKYAHRDNQIFNTGEVGRDARRRGQIGFRVDGGDSDADTWLIKGDAFHSRDNFIERPSGEFTELVVQGRWSHALATESRLNVQTYYRREYRRVPRQLTHHVDTADIDFQHAVGWRTRHRLVWGAGFRVNVDQSYGGTVAFEPAARTYSLFSVFAQDEIALQPDRLYVTAGLKMERNTFTGAEWQPNVRARFHITPRQMVWSAVSRAVRRPTRLDADVRALTPAGAVVAVGGGDRYESETLMATELGYRVQSHPGLSLDATVFSHRYDDLRSQELPPTGPPIVVGNTLNGRSDGVEFSAVVQPLPAWRAHLSYTFLDLSITRDPDSRDIGGGASESNDPQYHFGLRNSFDLPRNIEVDAMMRHIGALPNPSVPAYTELNMRIGWRATPHIELSVAGQDLLHDRHPEFGSSVPRRVEFERSVRMFIAFRY